MQVGNVDFLFFIENELRNLWLDKKPNVINSLKAKRMAENFEEFAPTVEEVKLFCKEWRDNADNFPTTKDFKKFIVRYKRDKNIGGEGCNLRLCGDSGVVPVVKIGEDVGLWEDAPHRLCVCHTDSRGKTPRLNGVSIEAIDKNLKVEGLRIHPQYIDFLWEDRVKEKPSLEYVEACFTEINNYTRGL